MARRKAPPPYPKRPHASGQARIRLNGCDIYLGAWGTEESRREYARRIGEWNADGQTMPVPSGGISTVSELLALYDLRQQDRMSVHQKLLFHQAAQPVYDLYGDANIESFGPLALKAVRREMIRRGLRARKTISIRINKIRSIWRWAASEELIPEDYYRRLMTVEHLGRGEEGAIDYEEVPPVPENDLTATLGYLGSVVRAMVEVQLYTGARPGEICRLRGCDIRRGERIEIARGHWLDTSDIWAAIYYPQRYRKGRQGQDPTPIGGNHKTAKLGHMRIILFGPKARDIVTPFLERRNPDEPIFSPRDSNRVSNRTRDAYDPITYRTAIQRACKRAGVAPWHPHQLRHSAATRLASEFGEEVARIILGHRSLEMTRRYVLDDLSRVLPAVVQTG